MSRQWWKHPHLLSGETYFKLFLFKLIFKGIVWLWRGYSPTKGRRNEKKQTNKQTNKQTKRYHLSFELRKRMSKIIITFKNESRYFWHLLTHVKFYCYFRRVATFGRSLLWELYGMWIASFTLRENWWMSWSINLTSSQSAKCSVFLACSMKRQRFIMTSWKPYVPFLFPSKSVQHFLSTCFVNEYFARNLL